MIFEASAAIRENNHEKGKVLLSGTVEGLTWNNGGSCETPHCYCGHI